MISISDVNWLIKICCCNSGGHKRWTKWWQESCATKAWQVGGTWTISWSRAVCQTWEKPFVHASVATKFVDVVFNITLPKAGAQNQIKRCNTKKTLVCTGKKVLDTEQQWRTPAQLRLRPHESNSSGHMTPLCLSATISKRCGIRQNMCQIESFPQQTRWNWPPRLTYDTRFSYLRC